MRVQKWLAGRGAGLLTAAALALTGCSGTGEAAESEPGRQARQLTELTSELRPAVESNNRFAWSVYQASSSPRQNLFFSPFSLTLALGMTYAGARGTTAAELGDALLVADEPTFHSGLGALGQDLGGEHPGRGYQLYLANRLFGARGTDWSPETLSLLQSNYQAPLEEVPFGSDPEAARTRVNDWVRQETREQLPELVPEGYFDSNTLFALVNASYFAASWHEAFDPKLSREAEFTLEDGSRVTVPMISRKARQLVAEGADLTLVELDYADRELSMLLLIPGSQGLAAVEATLSSEHIDQLLGSGSVHEAIVTLPRLELRTELPLTTVLQTLGVREAFDPSAADFSGMVKEPIAPGDIFLTSTHHQAYVQVDEQGTRAAAATAVVAGTRSATSEYVADRPFVFVIRDKLTGTSLFVGRVLDPRG